MPGSKGAGGSSSYFPDQKMVIVDSYTLYTCYYIDQVTYTA